MKLTEHQQTLMRYAAQCYKEGLPRFSSKEASRTSTVSPNNESGRYRDRRWAMVILRSLEKKGLLVALVSSTGSRTEFKLNHEHPEAFKFLLKCS